MIIVALFDDATLVTTFPTLVTTFVTLKSSEPRAESVDIPHRQV
jgi:hypothetical protein